MANISPGSHLRGRAREQEVLDRLLRDVHGGHSRALVLRGEYGIGKTALLTYLAGQAPVGRVVRTAGVETESEIPYAALQQVCAPLLDHLDRLPEAQRGALTTAFGLSRGKPPGQLLIALAVLGLLAEAAADEPLVCVVDDAEWLDGLSGAILASVARRLHAESVALVFAVSTSATAPAQANAEYLAGLPELRVDGLGDDDARALLDSVLPEPVDPQVRDRIVAEARGNPLALLELPRGLSPAELAFGFDGARSASPASRVEEDYRRQIAALPADTRQLVLAAAVEAVGDGTLLLRALERLGIGPEAAAPARIDGLMEIGARVRFRHPLVRAAARRSADAAELREVHRALAEVIDPSREPDRRAWHRAQAAVATDEEVAEELERSIGHALARGGYAAVAHVLERAAELSADSTAHAARLLVAADAYLTAGMPVRVPQLLDIAGTAPLDPKRQAHAERLRAQAAFALTHGRAAGPRLLAAAQRLAELEPTAARETYLWALGVALHAGPLAGEDLHRAAAGARAVPPGTDAVGLLLTGLATWVLDGHAAAVPELRRALRTLSEDDDLRLLWLAAPASHAVWDDETWYQLSERAVAHARATGALSLLPAALSSRAGALIQAGRFADAAALTDQIDALGRATGLVPDLCPALTLAAARGREAEARELIDTVLRDADAYGEGRLNGMADVAAALLYNGLGEYPAAMRAAQRAAGRDDLGVGNWALVESVEAAARAGETGIASRARERLSERTRSAGSDWALGVQALADALAGSPGEAEDRYREAIEQLSTTRLDLLVARARLLYGEWLRRAGRRTDARDELRAAHHAFAAMGAEAFARRAGRELQATGETVQSRTNGPRDELTPQETQVARLAVAGRTNAEIGAALFLSPRTVEWHLRKVFTKLRIATRRELAAALRVQP
ncbi:LuxR family transcriptional regulator [Nonomuraea africana]|uniref:DNA-binding CsgD family transcriptional regulator/tetratricopeptide (TPR) repeat protein n=1 Tax=Nonomuraea africana TaxID=46171 RepID=A0ABR9K771_9ACTN|nr:BREX system ATP-binding domain-containing protein [Nonomuraea africana]MBE1557655.1 DNA-binding CsgD family transcriptional regulator/tetratricopeptide (TPR) repeat protein [Nonomuraea africana]